MEFLHNTVCVPNMMTWRVSVTEFSPNHSQMFVRGVLNNSDQEQMLLSVNSIDAKWKIMQRKQQKTPVGEIPQVIGLIGNSSDGV